LRSGFAETSLDEIVADAGVVKQTLYNYFDNKEALFNEAIGLLTQQASVEHDTQRYQLPPKEFLYRVGEKQLQQFKNPRTTDFLRLLVKECRKYPQLQKIYSLSIPEPTIKFIVGYFQKGDTTSAAESAALYRLAWCFRAALTGYATLSNLGALINFSLPNQSTFLEVTVNLFEKQFALICSEDDFRAAKNKKNSDKSALAEPDSFAFRPATDKRTAILAAALETFSTTGFAETSMEEVANVAKTSKQTLYKYFKSKNILYTALCDDVISQLRNSSAPQLRQQVEFADYLIEYTRNFAARMNNPSLREYFRMVIGESQSFPAESGALLLYLFSFGTELLEAHIPKRADTNSLALAVMCRSILGSFLLAHQIYSIGDAPYIDQEGLISILTMIAAPESG
jgi:AcrR family transcriptional regulator